LRIAISSTDSHNNLQREYYESNLGKRAMQPSQGAYVLRHIDRMLAELDPPPGAEILEIGAGLGKFSLPLIERGFRMTCVDLSPVMLDRLRAEVGANSVETIAADAADIARCTARRFSYALGFFVLHHIDDMGRVFRGIREAMLPGGRVAFCEPVATNPLYYLQIAITPGMHWAAERGMVRMRPGIVLPALEAAGFVDARSHTCGFFPPQVTNRGWGARLEDRLDTHRFLAPLHAFRIFSASTPR
jgi:SAM-dependent methyltransferase